MGFIAVKHKNKYALDEFHFQSNFKWTFVSLHEL